PPQKSLHCFYICSNIFPKPNKTGFGGFNLLATRLGAPAAPPAMTPSNDSIKQKKTVIASGDQARYPCFQKTADQWSSVL
ncbi:hypothetical protein, partial [Klebsiella aerogenes]|uniref:hypothetical protein n=1 Tax=Klebsiella aerogenes TaxID=548 RepID=UPI002879A001